MKTLKAFIKSFETPQKGVKIKINFFSPSEIWAGSVKPNLFVHGEKQPFVEVLQNMCS